MASLNKITREVLREMFNDPNDFGYYTDEQIARINIEQMISDRDIGGMIYQTVDGRVLTLECDSDTYTLCLNWFINLDKNEVFIA